MSISRLLREPLVHFLVFGACLFGLFSVVNQDARPAPDEIIVGNDQIAVLEAQFERVWQRPPTDDEMDGLIESWVRDEIMYREGLALGLDQDDPVIRRRVAQKIAFMTDALVDIDPAEEDLQAWLESHPESYRIEPIVSFHQVYFDPQRHADDLQTVIDNALTLLQDDDGDKSRELGDASLLPGELQNASYSEVARTYGEGFAEALLGVSQKDWTGPVRSGYGLHLVKLDSVQPGRPAQLDDVRAAVARDLVAARREETDEAFYQAMRKQYEVTIARDPGTPGSGS